jgi:hypothetical protein
VLNPIQDFITFSSSSVTFPLVAAAGALALAAAPVPVVVNDVAFPAARLALGPARAEAVVAAGASDARGLAAVGRVGDMTPVILLPDDGVSLPSLVSFVSLASLASFASFEPAAGFDPVAPPAAVGFVLVDTDKAGLPPTGFEVPPADAEPGAKDARFVAAVPEVPAAEEVGARFPPTADEAVDGESL